MPPMPLHYVSCYKINGGQETDSLFFWRLHSSGSESRHKYAYNIFFYKLQITIMHLFLKSIYFSEISCSPFNFKYKFHWLLSQFGRLSISTPNSISFYFCFYFNGFKRLSGHSNISTLAFTEDIISQIWS